MVIGSDQENMESTLRRRMSTPDSSQSPYPSTNRIFWSRFVGVLLKNNFYFFLLPQCPNSYWFATSAVVNICYPFDFDEPLYYIGFGKTIFLVSTIKNFPTHEISQAISGDEFFHMVEVVEVFQIPYL